MLSVLVPIYNFDASEFVREISLQAVAANVIFEIRCYDDGSAEKFKNINSQKLPVIPAVIYRELPENIGRSRIRNLLAKEALYDFLLFVDCDLQITNPFFISNYLKQLDKNKILCGGISYQSAPPADPRLMLRWKYGRKRESIPVLQRTKLVYKSFMTSNFVMPKQLALTFKFNEDISGYGHEDTLLGIELNKNHIPVLHLDNALCHLGLESAEEFLKKTEEGIRNLSVLMKNGLKNADIRLLRTYNFLSSSGLKYFFLLLFFPAEKIILRNLRSAYPSILLFNAYKLGVLCRLM